MYLLGKQRQEDFTFKPKLTKHVKKINLNTKNIFKPMLKSVKRKVNRYKDE